MMSAAGSLGTVVLAFAGLGLLLTLALAGAVVMKKRVPLSMLVAVPILTCVAGAAGTYSSASGVLGGIGSVEIDTMHAAAFQGLWESLAVDLFSRWVAAFLLGAAAWASALGSLVAVGKDYRWTPFAAAFAAFFTLVGSVGTLLYASQNGVGGEAALLAILIGFSGFAVAASATRRALYEESHRVAGMRFAAGVCAVLAIGFGARAMSVGHYIESLGPNGVASKASDLASVIAMYSDVAAPVFSLTVGAILLALLIAFCGVFWELGEVVERYTLVDVWATLFLIAVLLISRQVEGGKIAQLTLVGGAAPAAALYAQFGADLSPALLSVDKEIKEVHPGPGGFNDVFAFSEDAWVRTAEWVGNGWRADQTPLDEVGVINGRALFAMESGADGLSLVRALEKTADGKGLLLMRAAEVKADLTVPSELAHLQVTYFPVALAVEHDLTTQIWSVAGKRTVMWGPITWYGEATGEEPLVYLNAVYEETEATTMQVLVDQRSRIKDIVSSCLPFVFESGDAGPALAEGRSCLINGIAEDFDKEEDREIWELWRDEAAENWDLPEPEFTKLAFDANKELDEFLGSDFVEDRFRRELGAIDWCINTAREEGEEAEGKMMLTVTLSKKGAPSTAIHEKSKVQSGAVARCFAKRIDTIRFEIEEEEEEEEGTEEEEPPPPRRGPPPEEPTVEIVLDLVTPPEFKEEL
jgi:hypothetical protein